MSWNPAAAQTAPTASAVTFSHGYDPTNRRVGQTATDNSWWSYPVNVTTATTAYTANNLNQYSAVGSVSPTYDGDGNLTYDGTFTYAYDAESRLTSVKQGSTTVASYAYDAQGRRKTKTVGSTTTVFATDADNREALEYDGTSGAAQRWYAFGRGPDEVLGQMNVAAGTRETMIPDIQGSIIGTLDSGGAIAKSGYQPYGENPTVITGTYRYTARRFDPETAGSTAQPSGLYYYRARMYSPTWGRFLQTDPLGYAAGGNLYAYVNNDPLNLKDPFGRTPDINVGLTPSQVLAVGRAISAYVQNNPISAISTALLIAGTIAQPENAPFLPEEIEAITAAEEAGVAARGLGQYGGIFSSSTNAAGGEVWTSVGEVSQNDFASIVNSGLMKGGDVNILTGVHGFANGEMAADLSLYNADVATFGRTPGVNIYNIPEMTPGEIGNVLNGPGTTIGGFCNSGACLAPFR